MYAMSTGEQLIKVYSMLGQAPERLGGLVDQKQTQDWFLALLRGGCDARSRKFRFE